MAIVVVEPLALRREAARRAWAQKQEADVCVTVGMGTCGIAAGAADALVPIQAELAARGLSAAITQVGCVGMCSFEPMVEIQARGRPRINYGAAIDKNIPEVFGHYFDGRALKKAVVVGQAIQNLEQAGGHTLQSLSFVHPKSTSAFRSRKSNCALCSATAA